MCAELVYPGRRFGDYAILRDDVVIADESVAKVYSDSAALGDLGVTISYSKSLISHSGSAEFAKRFRFRPATQSLCQGCSCS
jgi:hypothetical protein